MASSVTSIAAQGGTQVDGDVVFVSTQPGLLTLGSSGSNVSFAPVSAFVQTLNGKNGNPVLTSADGSQTISAPVLGNIINISGSTATSALANLTNLDASNAGLWVASNAYRKGACAFSAAASNDLYIARQDIVSSTTDPSTDATNWVKLATTTSGGGGGGIGGITGWSGSTAYNSNTIVQDQTSFFWTASGSTVGQSPFSSPAVWSPMGMNFVGAWNSNTSYLPQQVVSYSSDTWVALVGSSNSAPVAGSNWASLGSAVSGSIVTAITGDSGSNVSGVVDFRDSGSGAAQIAFASVPAQNEITASVSALYNTGQWSGATAYIPQQVALFNSIPWLCLTSNTSSQPSLANSNWVGLGNALPGIQSLNGTGLSTPTTNSNIQFTSSGSNISITTTAGSNAVDINFVGSITGGLTGFPASSYAWSAASSYSNLQDVVTYQNGLFATVSAFAPNSNQPWGTATSINWAQLVPNLAIQSSAAGANPAPIVAKIAKTQSNPDMVVFKYDLNSGVFMSDNGAGTITLTGGLVVGEIKIWAASAGNTPSGWALCDGSPVSRTTYATLFAALGVTYGAGDGTTTFNLPNLLGRFVQGDKNNNATVSGANTIALAASNIPSHTHTLSASATASQSPTASTSLSGSSTTAGATTGISWDTTYNIHTHTFNRTFFGSTGLGNGNDDPPKGFGTFNTSGPSDGASNTFQITENAHTHTFNTTGLSASTTISNAGITMGGSTDASGTGSNFSVLNENIAMKYIIWLGAF